MPRHKEFPFPDLGHVVGLQPDIYGQNKFTLNDLIKGKYVPVTVSGPTAVCMCGADIPIPGGSIKAFAKGLNGIPGDTYMMFYVSHNLDGVTSEETLNKKLGDFHEKRRKQQVAEQPANAKANSK